MDEGNGEIGVEYDIHKHLVGWRKMKPELGEKYKNPEQVKFCVRNYVVTNGFQLCFAKSDHDRILVVCRKGNDKKKYSYPLYASWIGNETTFQVKSLNDNHRCSRNFEF